MNRSRTAIAALALCGALSLATTASASAAVTVNPQNLAFPAQKIGSQSSPQAVIVKGSTCPDLPGPMGSIIPGSCPEPLDIAISGDFVIVSNNCPNPLPGELAAHTCTITVAAKPAALGPRAGFLRVQSTPSIVGASLAGTGCKKKKTKSGKKKLVCKAKPKKKKK